MFICSCTFIDLSEFFRTKFNSKTKTNEKEKYGKPESTTGEMLKKKINKNEEINLPHPQNKVLFLSFERENPHGVMAKVLDCGFEVSKFELQSCFYVQF